MDCVFCKIAKREISTTIIFEDKDVIAFNDVKPIAPTHILIVPKKHITSVAEVKDADALIMGKLIVSAKKIADKLGISQKGYKLLIRVGRGGGQEVDHIHLHLLGGAKLSENIHPVE